ncbi:PREDICTED: uncharacterized protein C20orf85 homolog [Priapulus caudatus]|uniref:Uncharacterized protein C20orf85 homolog n=1 Tax=Priapulus caudatus TaxID=37621 RepID=A0ABM1E090_PRICU|nr:PREDICTED: uncharacterized protein C20orf85 homolog [Priapulus caudatus]
MTKKNLNFVHSDEIWKDHVRHELLSSRHWPESWGYMTTEYNKLNEALCGGTTSGSQFVKLPPIEGALPKASFPKTTAGEIGWKSTRDDYRLEKYGRYAPNARGICGILKLLKWPYEGI